ncbi:hypothetical protein [Bacillus sp. FJAT-44742]|uniref:hypothetical protein n=1 Tax=Bacillus sp. FJAT-44742 TaxID=2014005 RepID=UPI0018E1EACA|nr:hypothetical protein [Bacillus sp. FJAT-44742]
MYEHRKDEENYMDLPCDWAKAKGGPKYAPSFLAIKRKKPEPLLKNGPGFLSRLSKSFS